MALLLAIRHGDYRVVREMVQVASVAETGSVDVNEEAHLESATAVPQELPSFPTTPLVEACRCGDERILRLLLARSDLDVNKRTTKLRHTALADACARGDVMSVRILLEDVRTDASLGDELVAHPALYCCMNGAVDVLQALASHGVLNDELEASLVATAAASEQPSVSSFLSDHYISVRPLSVLTRPQQERKVRMVCAKHESSAAPGHVPSAALSSICEALGASLSPEELREAFCVLKVGGRTGAAGDVLLRVDDIVAMWLLD